MVRSVPTYLVAQLQHSYSSLYRVLLFIRPVLDFKFFSAYEIAVSLSTSLTSHLLEYKDQDSWLRSTTGFVTLFSKHRQSIKHFIWISNFSQLYLYIIFHYSQCYLVWSWLTVGTTIFCCWGIPTFTGKILKMSRCCISQIYYFLST